MTTLEPLKSAISIGNVVDTSLALPSVNQRRTGRERVLEQVQSIRRTKSRQSRSCSSRSSSATSPTSPLYDVFREGLKSPLSPTNGNVFFTNGLTHTLNQEKNVNRQVVGNLWGSTVKRYTTASMCQAPKITLATGRARTSRSETDLTWQGPVPRRVAPLQSFASSTRTQQRASHYVTTTTDQSQWTANGTSSTVANNQFICSQVDSIKPPSKPQVTEATAKSKGDSGSNGNSGVADITMREAVEYLSSGDETYQHCGASYIQHNAFVDENCKEEVLRLNGVAPLVALLRSPQALVSQTAAAALRNLSFRSDKSKEAMHRSGGVAEAAAQLREADSVEMQKQLTGLLWNLSSADDLKPDLLKSALPVLMEHVILPYATDPDRTTGDSRDPEVFFHATGCLRNLSSAKQNNRQVMRKCRGLIDSLVSYVGGRVKAGKPDDKSVENCVCILHNLTFQLEAEAPALFSRIAALAKAPSQRHSQDDAGPIGCFGPQNKSPEHKRHFDFPVVEDPQPSGAGWLIHSKTLQTYLNLLSSSQREETQEACSGTLQNLTAQDGIVSDVMSQIIVQKVNGLNVISPLLRSSKVNLQRNMVALVGNLTKNPNLHTGLARRVLPELLAIISASTKEGNESDDTLAMACQAANCLLMQEPELGKHLLSSGLINSLNSLSQNNYFPKSSKAASLFLYNLWSEKDLQSHLKKQGMGKASFVNDATTSALRSVQVVS